MKTQEKNKEPIGNYIVPTATIIGAVLVVFAFNFLYTNRVESTVEYFDDSVEIIQNHINGDIKQLRWEVQQLRREVREVRETFQKWQEILQKMETLDAPPSAGFFEDLDPNLSLDSVPCCGGGDNVTNFESAQALPEDVGSFEEVLKHLRANCRKSSVSGWKKWIAKTKNTSIRWTRRVWQSWKAESKSTKTNCVRDLLP